MGLILHSFPVHTKDLHVSGKQKRNVVQEGKNGGQCSGSAIKNCNLNPVNECKWGQWETCSTTCGPGIQTRLIDQEASHCGKNCFGSDTKSCNLRKCPIVQSVLVFSDRSYGSRGANNDLLLLRNIIKLKLTQDTFALFDNY